MLLFLWNSRKGKTSDQSRSLLPRDVERRLTEKEHKGAFSGYENILYLGCSDDYTIVYICLNVYARLNLIYANYTSVK